MGILEHLLKLITNYQRYINQSKCTVGPSGRITLNSSPAHLRSPDQFNEQKLAEINGLLAGRKTQLKCIIIIMKSRTEALH